MDNLLIKTNHIKNFMKFISSIVKKSLDTKFLTIFMLII